MEQVELKKIMILGMCMMLKGCAMKASRVKKRRFMFAMQWNSRAELCTRSLSFGSLWLLRRAQILSLPWDFLQFLRDSAFVRSFAEAEPLFLVC